ncbi:MAG: PKD domain-containing protein [Owenweeksia sp.]|nr:PKD domain-containing protein [Owenweeksia sp.]
MEVIPQSGCAPLNVQVIDRSIGTYNTSWCLDYDPAMGTRNTPIFAGDTINHTYTNPGTYVVAQFVNNPCSSDTASPASPYIPLQRPCLRHSGNICQGNAVSFTDQTTGDTIASYQWSFGDSTTSNAINPVHLYNNPGTYICMPG